MAGLGGGRRWLVVWMVAGGGGVSVAGVSGRGRWCVVAGGAWWPVASVGGAGLRMGRSAAVAAGNGLPVGCIGGITGR